MRAKIEDPNAESTRLLLQKPKPYAELDENSRIALSIMQEDGWKLQRIGMEVGIDITVNATPIERPGIASDLAEAELRYTALRSEVVRLQQRHIAMRRRHWLAAAAGCFVCSAMAFFHLTVAMTPLGAVCVVLWRFAGYRRAKGAK